MEMRKMEKLGIETSLLGFGCMRFPVNAEGKIDRPRAQEMLDRAIAAGVNYIDRSSLYIATKLPVWMVNSVADAERIFKEQLDHLQSDYVDFYLLHAMGRERFESMRDLGVIDRLVQLKKDGKIKYLGFSFHDSYEVFEEMINYRDWDFCQIQLNYMDTEEQAGLKGYQLATDKGIPVVVMEPVKGGSLANFAEDITARFRALDPEASTASFALRYVGSLPGVKVVLSGMSNMEQTEDNLKTFTDFKVLSDKEQQEIQDIVTLLRSRVQNGCTGCRYCMPCPAGVDIPGCFQAWNTYHMYQNYDVVRWTWETNLGEAKQAKNCIQCGKCEGACPQKISIREDLKKVQKDLEEKIY